MDIFQSKLAKITVLGHFWSFLAISGLFGDNFENSRNLDNFLAFWQFDVIFDILTSIGRCNDVNLTF